MLGKAKQEALSAALLFMELLLTFLFVGSAILGMLTLTSWRGSFGGT